MRPTSPLDDDQLYRALAARDARFDGVFFVGVTSTGIYCRPVCRARTPGAARCRFFASAAAAERRGFRPCLRCRPELAPAVADAAVADAAGRDAAGDGVASVDAVRRLARAAGARIAAGALDGDGGVDALAARSASRRATCAARSSASSARARWRSRRRGGCSSPSSCSPRRGCRSRAWRRRAASAACGGSTACSRRATG
jgi:hypothetical protein